ncbi:MAG: hypothetical protein PHQ91_15935, partial [Thermoanaerobaculaceae bacterium]|nr:hypothetical protein [Thermoanaerobaculaceae bacterium]
CSECKKMKSIEEIGAKIMFGKIQQNEIIIEHQKEREIYFICNKCLIKNTKKYCEKIHNKTQSKNYNVYN